jgi:toxin ParE1/3/4
LKLYSLTPEARQDIAGIWRYSAKRWDASQANRYLSSINAALEEIAKSPSMGRRCDDLRAGYRRHRVSSHIICFRPISDGIEVIRILHQSMDFRRHLREEK